MIKETCPDDVGSNDTIHQLRNDIEVGRMRRDGSASLQV